MAKFGKKREGLTHTLKVRMQTTARDERIIDQRMRAKGQCKNAARQILVERAHAMRADERWAKARRIADPQLKSEAYNALYSEYKLTAHEAANLAFSHWQASKWMATVIQSAPVLACGREALAEVQAWLLGNVKNPPGPQATAAEDQVSGNNGEAIRLVGHELCWNQPWTAEQQADYKQREAKLQERYQDGELSRKEYSRALARMRRRKRSKNLQIALERDFRPGKPQWEKRLAGREVLRVGMARELVRGKNRYFALITLAGAPYRDSEHLRRVKRASQDGSACFDAGTSKLAVVGAHAGVIVNLAPDELLDERRAQAKTLRRLRRAQERSREANNPRAYRGRGRKGRVRHAPRRAGRRRLRKSSAYERRQRRIQGIYAQGVHQRKRDAHDIARLVTELVGNILAHEDVSYAAWQRALRFGGRMAVTAPGAVQSRLLWEALVTGGPEALKLALSLALSQQCQCGERVKKPLCLREHTCESCGLLRLDRDLYSGFLGRLIADGALVKDEQTGRLAPGPKFDELDELLSQYFPRSSTSKVASGSEPDALTRGSGIRWQAEALCRVEVPAPVPLRAQHYGERSSSRAPTRQERSDGNVSSHRVAVTGLTRSPQAGVSRSRAAARKALPRLHEEAQPALSATSAQSRAGDSRQAGGLAVVRSTRAHKNPG